MHKNLNTYTGQNDGNTMTESVFATDKWRLRQSSLDPPKRLVLEVKTCEESSLTFTEISQSFRRQVLKDVRE